MRRPGRPLAPLVLCLLATVTVAATGSQVAA